MPIPSEIIAGNSATWTKAVGTSGEVVRHCFRDGDGGGLNITGVTSGATHTFTLERGASAALKPVWYDVSETITLTDGTRSGTRNIARVRVYPDPEATKEESDNEATLASLKKALADRIKFGMIESKSVAGVNVAKTPIETLQSLISEYERRVLRERSTGRMARGRSSGNAMKIKF